MDRLSHDMSSRRYGPRWSVGIVLLVALALMLAVPLAHRALGQGGGSAGSGPTTFPGCGIAPWTGTCTCMLTQNGSAMSFDAFAQRVRDPNVRPRIKNPDDVLSTARRDCRMPTDQPAQTLLR